MLAKAALAHELEINNLPSVVDVILTRLALQCYSSGAKSIERRMNRRVILADKSIAVADTPDVDSFDDQDTPVMGMRSLKKR